MPIGVAYIFQYICNPSGNYLHLFFFHSARGESRCADADTACDKRRARLARDRVFVDCDAGSSKGVFCVLAGNSLFGQINEKEMAVRSSGNYSIAAIGKRYGKGLCVLYYLLTVCFIFRLKVFIKCDRLGCKDVRVRLALKAGEYRLVYLLCSFVPGHDHPSAWAAERLVGGRGDIIAIRNGVGKKSGSNKPG